MKYVGIKTVQGAGIGLNRACSNCGTAVEQIRVDGSLKDPAYCPHCGHRLSGIPPGINADNLVALLNARTPRPPDNGGE